MRHRQFTAAALVAALAGTAFGGTSVLFPAQFNLSTLLPANGGTGAAGFEIKPVIANDLAGYSVSSAGDVNGDGFDDLIIGAPRADPDGIVDAGRSYVVFGGPKVGAGGEFSLASLNGVNGFVLNGVDALDRSGVSVSSAGDVNGDGIDDLIIAAPWADPNGISYAGECYVVFGRDTAKTGDFPAALDLSSLNGVAGFVLNGIDNYDTVSCVASAADVNGDGVDDLIVGAYLAAPNDNFNAGECYVVFGGEGIGAEGAMELSSLDGVDGFVINGVDAGDRCGRSVASAGDLNGDGISDLIIGARYAAPNGNLKAGESYVVYGAVGLGQAGALNLASLGGADGFVLTGVDRADASGWSVSSAGDVNSDGFDDLIIGALGGDPGGRWGAGESYVVFGASGLGAGGSLSLSSLNGDNGFVINGVDKYDQSGSSVSMAGDVNGDGIDDLIIGAWSADPDGHSSAGESYIVFGRKGLGSGGTLELSTLNGANGFVLNGINANDASGWVVDSAGDLNGDGIGDLVVAAIGAAKCYVVFGRQAAPPACPGDANGDKLVDFNDVSIVLANWQANYELNSGPGDANGDGIVDLTDFNAVLSNWLSSCP